MSSSFSLERFESAVYESRPDEAIALLCEFKALLESTPFPSLLTLMAADITWEPSQHGRLMVRFARRMAAAIVSLLGNTDFTLSEEQFFLLSGVRSLIQHLLGSAPLTNADYVARKFLPSIAEDGTVRAPFPDAVKRLNILCNSESQLPLDFSTLLRLDRYATFNLAIAAAGEVMPGSAAAHQRREALIDWLNEAFLQATDIYEFEVLGLLSIYMHCTYVETEHRHDIKQNINRLVRKSLADNGLGDLDIGHGKLKRASRQRPLMVVVLDIFTDGHSILRTHSVNLMAARAHFDTVAFCVPTSIGDAGREVFTRVIEFPPDDSVPQHLAMLRDFAQTECPDVLYMPSVGMSFYTLFASNMRLAPIQIAGLGHPATTHSDCIDYVSVEDDYVGDPACFSEALLRLPKNGQPYRPSQNLEPITPPTKSSRTRINVAIAASLMKLSPSFLAACRQIAERSKVPVCLHFLTSGGDIVTLMHLHRVLADASGDRLMQIHPPRPYMDYMRFLKDMDMFLSPFPFGNTNGIVDAFTVGLPGVCKTGREVFERIDGAMFMRAYMPGWLVADTVEEYVEAAVRLANNHEERESLHKYMLEKNVVQRFFEGRPEVFGEMVLDLVNEQRLKTA